MVWGSWRDWSNNRLTGHEKSLIGRGSPYKRETADNALKFSSHIFTLSLFIFQHGRVRERSLKTGKADLKGHMLAGHSDADDT